MTASASGEESPLANKCFDFCKALASQGMAFSFSLTLGSNFSFSLDTREMAPHSVTQGKAWKKKSPSTIRRNARRRDEFLKMKQSPAAAPARPLNILSSPTDSSGRRHVVSLGRDATVPSFTQLDGAATASPPPEFPSYQPPQAESHCQTVEYHADYGDPPPSDAPPPPACDSCHGPTEWGFTRGLDNKTMHVYHCLEFCMFGGSRMTTTVFT